MQPNARESGSADAVNGLYLTLNELERRGSTLARNASENRLPTVRPIAAQALRDLPAEPIATSVFAHRRSESERVPHLW